MRLCRGGGWQWGRQHLVQQRLGEIALIGENPSPSESFSPVTLQAKNQPRRGDPLGQPSDALLPLLPALMAVRRLGDGGTVDAGLPATVIQTGQWLTCRTPAVSPGDPWAAVLPHHAQEGSPLNLFALSLEWRQPTTACRLP